MGGLVVRKALKPRGHSSHTRPPCGTRLLFMSKSEVWIVHDIVMNLVYLWDTENGDYHNEVSISLAIFTPGRDIQCHTLLPKRKKSCVSFGEECISTNDNLSVTF